MAVMSDDNIFIVVGSDGLWDGVPVGTLPRVSCIDFDGEIGPMPHDREFPRAHSIDGRASEHVHEWWDLPKLRHLTLRYVRPEHVGHLAGYRGEWVGVYQGSGLPKGTVWPELPTVRSASWALMPVASLHGLKAPVLESVDVDGVRECLGLEDLLAASPVRQLRVWNVRQVPSPQALWESAEDVEEVHWGGDAKADLWGVELALGPTARRALGARIRLEAVRRRATRIRRAALKEATFAEVDGRADAVRAVLPALSGEIAELLQRMGVRDPGVFWSGLLSVRWPCLVEAGVGIAVEDDAVVVSGPGEAVEDTVALVAWWCSSAEVLASVVDVLVSAGLAGVAFAGGGPAVVPVSRLVTGSSVASIEKLEERTYVLTMPMQPVPTTEVLEARGLEHSGNTWDQILELGFPAEVRRVELDGEADVFMAYGTRPALKKVQAVLDRLTQDADELKACLERIESAGHVVDC